MKDIKENFIDDLLKLKPKEIIGSTKVGIEKEGLRIFNSGITQTEHPTKLGSALCNQFITTDFSEAQLELITPAFSDKNDVKDFLESLHHFISNNINNEIIWPFSVPPFIESEQRIPIANYGTSNLGVFKRLYREGLYHRYGKEMQTISGVHYNFSLPDSIWGSSLFENIKTKKRNIRSVMYFRMLRNIFRHNWLILYLFGASPVITKDFLKNNDSSLKKLNKYTYYLPFATSLRMSNYGYQNLLRSNLNISTNSIENYIFDLSVATKTPRQDFQNIKPLNKKKQIQINENILQIDDEYYANARPKSSIVSNTSLASRLKQSGVDYIELRSLDLNPFSRIGIDIETINFLEVFLIYCCFKESELISDYEMEYIKTNDLLVATKGRSSSLKLFNGKTKITLKECGRKILHEMLPIAEFLDSETTSYSNCIRKMKLKIENPEQTPSGIILEKLIKGKQSFNDFGTSIGEENKDHYKSIDKAQNKRWQLLETEAKDSLFRQLKLEQENQESFDNFLEGYFR